jgi:hypothetical protein
MVNASVCLATIEYHQQAVDLFSPFNHEWCTYYLNSGFDKQQSFKLFAATEDSDYGSDQNLVLGYTYQFN